MVVSRLIVAVTGASGAIYAERTLKALLENKHHLDLVVSKYGSRLLAEERDLPAKASALPAAIMKRYQIDAPDDAITVHDDRDLGASIASGSHHVDGMVIVPASMKTVAVVAAGMADSLIGRAAAVTLKERRPLVVVPRETPLNRIHLENFLRLHDAGAVVMPANPGFYQGPKTLEDLGDFIAARIMDRLGCPAGSDLVPRWKGES
jgi:4-hydroxy-3-polyprenylbenzoate decarboxylase